jgi:hypothetical protein
MDYCRRLQISKQEFFSEAGRDASTPVNRDELTHSSTFRRHAPCDSAPRQRVGLLHKVVTIPLCIGLNHLAPLVFGSGQSLRTSIAPPAVSLPEQVHNRKLGMEVKDTPN